MIKDQEDLTDMIKAYHLSQEQTKDNEEFLLKGEGKELYKENSNAYKASRNLALF